MLQKIVNILAALALVFGVALIALAVYLMFFNEPPPPPPVQLPRINKPAAPNAVAPAAAKLPAPQ